MQAFVISVSKRESSLMWERRFSLALAAGLGFKYCSKRSKSFGLNVVTFPFSLYRPALPAICLTSDCFRATGPYCVNLRIVRNITLYMFKLSPIPIASVASKYLTPSALALNRVAWAFLISGGKEP